ncbi:MAG: S8 family serine peptidase [Deltaproteobacteria bacterium]|nr:S8 family serine peptidase [Deltaproteobacteria bacterium]
MEGAGIRDKFLHATAAGNNFGLDAADSFEFNAAAITPGLSSSSGDPVSNLTNLLITQSRDVDTALSPKLRAGSVSDFSSTNGNISAIGNGVNSASQEAVHMASGPSSASNAIEDRGTSFATPQVAGLAAYLFAIDPTLSISTVKNIILTSAAPASGGPPSLDSYAAVLSVDKGITPSGAPVRMALLDVIPAGQVEFAYPEFLLFLDEYAQRIANLNGKTNIEPDYSRYDLNGDGFTAGADGSRFDLDADGVIDTSEQELTDLQILCYFANGPLFSGSQADVRQAIDEVKTQFPTTDLDCPSLEILVQTNDPGGPFDTAFASFDSKVSVNDAGRVAFSGSNSVGASAGFSTIKPGRPTRFSFESTFNQRRFSGASINDKQPSEAAFRSLCPEPRRRT